MVSMIKALPSLAKAIENSRGLILPLYLSWQQSIQGAPHTLLFEEDLRERRKY